MHGFNSIPTSPKNTSAIIRIRTGNTKGDPEFGNTLNNDIAFDRLAINHKFNTANTISLGRTGLDLVKVWHIAMNPLTA